MGLTLVNSESMFHHSSQHTAQICGAIAHASRRLMQINCPDKASNCCKNFLEGIGVSGFVRMVADDYSRCIFINKGLKRKALEQFSDILLNDQKITYNDSILSIRTKAVYLIIETVEYEQVFKDALLDNLAIFVDTVDSWFEQYQKKSLLISELNTVNQSHSQLLLESLQTVESISDNLQMSHQQLVEQLVCKLTSLFPTLALECDQEEAIMEHITHSCEQHQGQINKQITANQSLCKQIESTISILLKQSGFQDASEDECIEFSEDADIELF